MNIKSKVQSIQAWPVDIKAVEKYISDDVWNGDKWVKDLLDGKENSELKYEGTRYLQVDFDEYKKFPPNLMLNKGASCRDGDYAWYNQKRTQRITTRGAKFSLCLLY